MSPVYAANDRPLPAGVEHAHLSASGHQMEDTPSWNNVCGTQERALPDDKPGELFRPGELIPARQHIVERHAFERWRDAQPCLRDPLRRWRARRRAMMRVSKYENMPVLRLLAAPGPPPIELADAARREGLPAVLFEEWPGRPVLAILDFEVARDYMVSYEERRARPMRGSSGHAIVVER